MPTAVSLERRSQSRSSPILVGQVQRRNRQKGTQFAPFSPEFFPRLRGRRHAARPVPKCSRRSWFFSRICREPRLLYRRINSDPRCALGRTPLAPIGGALPMLAAFPLAASFAQLDNYVAKNVLLRQNWSPNDHLCRQKCEFATKLPATKPTARASDNFLQPTAFSPPPTPSAIRQSSFGFQSFPGDSHSSHSWFTPPLPHSPFRALSCLWWFTLSVGRRAPDDHLR
jgi:hypothetical protein